MPKPQSPELKIIDKTQKAPKEPKEPRAPKEPKEPRVPKEPKEPKTPKEPKEPRAPKEPKEKASKELNDEIDIISNGEFEFDEKSKKENRFSDTGYPDAISKLLELSLMEADKVREAFKGRNRQNYIRMFDAYKSKSKLNERDYSIIRGATGYLYDYSRINSIDEDTALWMLGIHEIPASQILCYTSKTILEKIAKDHGVRHSGRKAETLIENIRSVLDHSK